MKQFRKVLVGVDLSVGDKLVGEELPGTHMSRRSSAPLWLAKENSAQLQFFCALDIGYHAQRLVQEPTR